MRIRLRYFAALREQAGVDTEDIELPGGTTVLQAFQHRFPALGLRVAFARNEAMCPPSTVLTDGDELALLPPLGGG